MEMIRGNCGGNLGSTKVNTKSFETIKDPDGNILSGKAAYDYFFFF